MKKYENPFKTQTALTCGLEPGLRLSHGLTDRCKVGHTTTPP